MRNLAVLTTTAAIALLGVANAEEAGTRGGDPSQAAIGAYAAYQLDITTLRTARIGDAAALESIIDRAASHNRNAVGQGWIGYGASTASQSNEFVQGVREASRHYGRDAMISALAGNPAYARTLPGGNDATKLVLDASAADGARIIEVAERYREQAYSLQRQRWANAVAPAQAARVQRVRSLAATGSSAASLSDVSPRLAVTPVSFQPGNDPSAFGGRRFWETVRGGAQVTPVANTVTYRFRVDPGRGEAVNRMLTISALQALDAGTERASTVSTLLSEPRTEYCMQMAQLQLYQCMSAARFRYENAFCLAQHAMRDVGSCISAVATPDTTAMTPAPGRGG